MTKLRLCKPQNEDIWKNTKPSSPKCRFLCGIIVTEYNFLSWDCKKKQARYDTCLRQPKNSGLRGTNYPGSPSAKPAQPQRGCPDSSDSRTRAQCSFVRHYFCGRAGTSPCLVITALIFSRSGGPPALTMAAISRK